MFCGAVNRYRTLLFCLSKTCHLSSAGKFMAIFVQISLNQNFYLPVIYNYIHTCLHTRDIQLTPSATHIQAGVAIYVGSVKNVYVCMPLPRSVHAFVSVCVRSCLDIPRTYTNTHTCTPAHTPTRVHTHIRCVSHAR